MGIFRRNAVVAGVVALASHAAAQVASVCPTTDVCFKLNIPQSTESSGSGDIFFQLSAPSDYEYIALGQGTSMSGSQIFVVYTSGDGNVTISPRLGTGHSMPNFNSDAKVTLLEGSGVSNGKMVANVKCSSCNSWSGGSASFSGDNGNWIYAYRSSGGPKDSNDQSASIQQHSDENAFQWDYANAKGGSSANPLVNSSPTATGGSGSGGTTSCVPRPSSTGGSAASASAAATSTSDDDDNQTSRGRPTNWPTARPTNRPPDKRDDTNYCDDSSNSNGNTNSGFTPLRSSGGLEKTRKMLIAHGTLAGLAFVIFFPVGAIAIRLASFTGLVWLHAAFQVFAYLVYIIAFGLGIYIANEYELLDETHPIIGIVVFVCLFFQPIFGFLHHALYKKYQSRTFWSYAHIWVGRAVITLGIINGGLGFQLADKMNLSSKSGMIAYGVIAGIIWLIWVVAIVIGERRRSRAVANAPPKYTPDSPRAETTERSDIPHPENGHYAPR